MTSLLFLNGIIIIQLIKDAKTEDVFRQVSHTDSDDLVSVFGFELKSVSHFQRFSACQFSWQ